MLQVNYNPSTGIINLVNLIQEDIVADYVIKDLDSNLTINCTWLYIPLHGYLNLTLNPETIPVVNSTGFKFYLCKPNTDEIIFSHEVNPYSHISQNYLHVPLRDITYAPWLSLLNGECNFIYPNSNDVLYDLGANVGTFTQYFLNKNIKHVYSFEPTPNLVKNLQQSFGSNSKVTIFDKAISPITSLLDFNIFPYSVANTLTNRYLDSKTDNIKVQGINLEEFVLEHNLLSPTIIKMDIEGSEYEVLDNLSDNFISSVRYFYLEWHENYENQLTLIIQRFSDLGFTYKIDPRWDIQNSVGVIIFYKN